MCDNRVVCISPHVVRPCAEGQLWGEFVQIRQACSSRGRRMIRGWIRPAGLQISESRHDCHRWSSKFVYEGVTDIVHHNLRPQGAGGDVSQTGPHATTASWRCDKQNSCFMFSPPQFRVLDRVPFYLHQSYLLRLAIKLISKDQGCTICAPKEK